MRLVIIAAACAAVSGCALFKPIDAREASSIARGEPVGGIVEPVAYAPPPSASARGPVGLTPCARGAFPTSACWRKGDQHVLFPPELSTAALGGSAGRETVTVSQGR